MINRTESILIGAPQNPPKNVSRDSACFFWLLMLRVLPSEPIMFSYGDASRAVAQVEQASQGSPLRFDERAPTTVPTACAALTRVLPTSLGGNIPPNHRTHRLRGLDKPCSVRSNPHRESGTRFGLRQTLDRQAGGSSRSAEGYAGTVWATPLEQSFQTFVGVNYFMHIFDWSGRSAQHFLT